MEYCQCQLSRTIQFSVWKRSLLLQQQITEHHSMFVMFWSRKAQSGEKSVCSVKIPCATINMPVLFQATTLHGLVKAHNCAASSHLCATHTFFPVYWWLFLDHFCRLSNMRLLAINESAKTRACAHNACAVRFKKSFEFLVFSCRIFRSNFALAAASTMRGVCEQSRFSSHLAQEKIANMTVNHS